MLNWVSTIIIAYYTKKKNQKKYLFPINNEREKAQHFPCDESIEVSAKQLWVFFSG
jgi:hypothetical protein